MKIETLTCPNCGASLPTDLSPNQAVECSGCGTSLLMTDLAVEQAISCPTCHTINPIERRFCAKCGDPLKELCILCHTPNSLDATYCRNCGAHMALAQTSRRQMMEDRRRLQQEREQLLQEKTLRQQAEKLQRLLADLDEPENHDFAIYQINQMGEAAVQPLIETLLNDADPDARYGSARALGQICKEHEVKGLIKGRSVKALIKALEDREPSVRYWSADALGKCGAQTALDPLTALLKDRHEGVRQCAERALHQLAGEQAAEIIKKSRGILGRI